MTISTRHDPRSDSKAADIEALDINIQSASGVVRFGKMVLGLCFVVAGVLVFLHIVMGINEHLLSIGGGVLILGMSVRFFCEAIRGAVAGVVVPWRWGRAPVFKSDQPVRHAMAMANQILGGLAMGALGGFIFWANFA